MEDVRRTAVERWKYCDGDSINMVLGGDSFTLGMVLGWGQ